MIAVPTWRMREAQLTRLDCSRARRTTGPISRARKPTVSTAPSTAQRTAGDTPLRPGGGGSGPADGGAGAVIVAGFSPPAAPGGGAGWTDERKRAHRASAGTGVMLSAVNVPAQLLHD